MRPLFIATVSVIVRDPLEARALFEGALGIRFRGSPGEYAFTEELAGTKHFSLWPLEEAAQACFQTSEWPKNLLVPQMSVEFEVEDPEAAAAELEQRGYKLLHRARTEPWKQTVARLLTSDGVIVGVCHTPSLLKESTKSSTKK